MRGSRNRRERSRLAHEIVGVIAGTDDAHMHSDVAVGRADRLDGGDLHAGGKNGFHGFHGEGPGKGLCVEELVELFGLSEHARILGPAHHGGGCGTLGFDTGKPAVERVLEIAGRVGLAVEEMKAQEEEETEHGERSHGDAQTLDRRTDVGVGASGEIERNPHRVSSLPPARLRRRQNWFEEAQS